jgi:hemerythrin-like metal-binding protein
LLLIIVTGRLPQFLKRLNPALRLAEGRKAMPGETMGQSLHDFDAEHIALSQQIDAIRDAFQVNQPDTQAIVSLVTALYEMAKDHFAHEELHLIAIHADNFLSHQRDHEYLLRSLSEYIALFVDGRISVSPGAANGFMSWLNHHKSKYDLRAGVIQGSA